MKVQHRTWGRWFLRGLLLIVSLALLLTVFLFGISQYMKAHAAPYLISTEDAGVLDQVDSILILGCGLRDGHPSAMLQDRLEQGLSLYRYGLSNRLLMSGDHGQPEYDEVNVMKAYAIEMGVPSEQIFMDHAGFSTYESMYRAKDVFLAHRVIIVTQSYHLYRAVYVARALGLDAYGVAAESRNYAGQAYRDLREILARNKDFLYTIVQPKPLLGPVIPVSGDGNLTNDEVPS